MTNYRNATLMLIFCSACSGSVTKQLGTQWVKTGTFGPSGGTLAVAASDDASLQGTQITILPGALSAQTTIKIGVTNAVVSADNPLGPVIDFEPSGLVFTTPARVTIPVNLAGLDPSRVGVMAVEFDGSSHDITAVTIASGGASSLATFQILGFTDYYGHDEGEHHHEDGGCTRACHDSDICGSDDGCGGTCDGNCGDAGEACKSPFIECNHLDGGIGEGDGPDAFCVNAQTSGDDCGSCGNACGDGKHCADGVCTCTAHCGGDAACGSSDGCGGTCDHNCDDGGTCTPTCGDHAECGSSDGCGGTCDRNCDGGTCTPSCGDHAECGSSDGCGGTCDRNCHDGGDCTYPDEQDGGNLFPHVALGDGWVNFKGGADTNVAIGHENDAVLQLHCSGERYALIDVSAAWCPHSQQFANDVPVDFEAGWLASGGTVLTVLEGNADNSGQATDDDLTSWATNYRTNFSLVNDPNQNLVTALGPIKAWPAQYIVRLSDMQIVEFELGANDTFYADYTGVLDADGGM